MSSTFLGTVLIIIGLVALVAGIAGGIAKMFREISDRLNRSNEPTLLPTELIQALIEFLKALRNSPVWLALTIIGIFLIGWGGTFLKIVPCG